MPLGEQPYPPYEAQPTPEEAQVKRSETALVKYAHMAIDRAEAAAPKPRGLLAAAGAVLRPVKTETAKAFYRAPNAEGDMTDYAAWLETRGCFFPIDLFTQAVRYRGTETIHMGEPRRRLSVTVHDEVRYDGLDMAQLSPLNQVEHAHNALKTVVLVAQAAERKLAAHN